MHSELEKALKHLVHHVLTFEDRVWNSAEYEISEEEAERAAAHLIYNHLIDQWGVSHIDGADIGLAVESIDQPIILVDWNEIIHND